MAGTRAIVIGGGIGGLAAGVALRRAGIDAAVYERSPEIGQLGSGLFLWTNGVRALHHLGLGERVEAMGTAVERFQYLSPSGKVLYEWPVGELGRRTGTPSVGVRRPELQALLAEEVGEALHLGAQCVGVAADADGVTVRFADGREERGDVLIGADGYDSVVATELGLQTEPRYGGYATWRGVVDLAHDSAPPGLARQHVGSDRQCLFLHVGHGRVYWAASQPTAEGELGPKTGLKEWLLAPYREFPEPVAALIEATDEASIRASGIFDREPKTSWGAGRVTLLGDAAHPMLPTQGQGACQALEDAVVLAKCLAAAADPAEGLREYERRRIPRATEFVEGSREVARRGQVKSPIARLIRPLIFKRIMGRMRAHREKLLEADVLS